MTRGRASEAKLMARLQRCAAAGDHVPKNHVLAAEIGCAETTVVAAMGRLMDSGRLVLAQRKMVRVVVEARAR